MSNGDVFTNPLGWPVITGEVYGGHAREVWRCSSKLCGRTVFTSRWTKSRLMFEHGNEHSQKPIGQTAQGARVVVAEARSAS